MTCETARDLFDRRLDGDLTVPEDRWLADHLASCDGCRSDLEAAEMVRSRLGGLGREIHPSADLWPQIAPRLRHDPRSSTRRLWWTLAAAVALVTTSSALTWVALRSRLVGAADLRAVDAHYARVALDLGTWYQRNQGTLAPATREVLERNLAVIERALAEARAALEADPGNAALASMVAAAYRRKIDFLERAGALDRES
jgi:predicted anti-sigma-YlaC factor YlaD